MPTRVLPANMMEMMLTPRRQNRSGVDILNQKKFHMPTAYTILFLLLILVAAATWIIPAGSYDYVDGVPVAESIFGQDPFEPVTVSFLPDILRSQTEKPTVIHRLSGDAAPVCPGIQIYDAETDADLARLSRALGTEGVHISAGCAGFAAALADLLKLHGPAPRQPRLPALFLVACGSVNPVTLRQMRMAEQHGFVHIHLTPEQKLEPAWLESQECREKIADVEILNCINPEEFEKLGSYLGIC